MDWQARIAIDPAILVGKPVIRGTRLAVEFIIDLMAQGWSESQILDNYPGVTADDIRACLAYASSVLHSEKVYMFDTAQSPAMRLLADENFPHIAVVALRDAGHDVYWVRGEAPGSADVAILEQAVAD